MWEQISSNRPRSVALTIGIGAILLLVGYLIGLYFFGNGYAGIVIALIIWGIMNLVAIFQGDSILLSISKAKKIRKSDHPRLYNIVEEMQIASGLEKMPDIYIIDDPALNAFATGRDPKRASVAITSGLLEKLNRDELQGVIAHEIAHIKNRDVLAYGHVRHPARQHCHAVLVCLKGVLFWRRVPQPDELIFGRRWRHNHHSGYCAYDYRAPRCPAHLLRYLMEA